VGPGTAIGKEVTLFKVGDVVLSAGDVARQGSNSEFQLGDERILVRAPKNITKAEAAALPLTAITADEMLFDRLQVDFKNRFSISAPTILITGAAVCVGIAMIQIAKALIPESIVIATASRPESQAWCTKMGAAQVISHAKNDGGIAAQLASIGIKQASHIASLTHTSQHFDDYIEVIKPQGKICLIDDPTEPLNIHGLKMTSVSLNWELMFTRARVETDDMIKQHHILNKISELLDSGKIVTTATKNLGDITVENLTAAHAMVEKGDMIGKVVLEMR
jgi:zinc-binding alcohol dehydrogenase family protein